jgi:hypothetical protein
MSLCTRMADTRTGVLAVFVVAAAFVLGACTATAAQARRPGLEVVGFLGEQRIAPGTTFEGTTVGGFSGLDRDPRGDGWFVISDDRSALQPARFYSADLRFEGPDGALSGVELTGTGRSFDPAAHGTRPSRPATAPRPTLRTSASTRSRGGSCGARRASGSSPRTGSRPR